MATVIAETSDSLSSLLDSQRKQCSLHGMELADVEARLQSVRREREQLQQKLLSMEVQISPRSAHINQRLTQLRDQLWQVAADQASSAPAVSPRALSPALRAPSQRFINLLETILSVSTSPLPPPSLTPPRFQELAQQVAGHLTTLLSWLSEESVEEVDYPTLHALCHDLEQRRRLLRCRGWKLLHDTVSFPPSPSECLVCVKRRVVTERGEGAEQHTGLGMVYAGMILLCRPEEAGVLESMQRKVGQMVGRRVGRLLRVLQGRMEVEVEEEEGGEVARLMCAADTDVSVLGGREEAFVLQQLSVVRDFVERYIVEGEDGRTSPGSQNGLSALHEEVEQALRQLESTLPSYIRALSPTQDEALANLRDTLLRQGSLDIQDVHQALWHARVHPRDLLALYSSLRLPLNLDLMTLVGLIHLRGRSEGRAYAELGLLAL